MGIFGASSMNAHERRTLRNPVANLGNKHESHTRINAVFFPRPSAAQGVADRTEGLAINGGHVAGARCRKINVRGGDG